MKTHLSSHIVLTCLITILTASGIIIKNVYSAEHELTIVVTDIATDEVFQCPNLAPPILATFSASAGKDPIRPKGVSTSITSFYKSERGRVDSSVAYYLNITPNNPITIRLHEVPRDIIIDPGQEQDFEAYLITRAWKTKGPVKLRQQFHFVSLEDGEECEFAALTVGREPALRMKVGTSTSF